MKYTFDPETRTVTSEDGSFSVLLHACTREGRWQFLVTYNGKKFGFETGESGSADRADLRDDGTAVWPIANICVDFYQYNVHNAVVFEYTDTYRFTDLNEQREVITNFCDAMAVFVHGKEVRSVVTFNAAVQKGLDAGGWIL